MPIEAYVKRELEQQEFLERIEKRLLLENDGEGDYLSDPDILRHAEYLLASVREEMLGESTRCTNERVATVIDEVNQFARTPEEGMALKKRMLEKLIQQGFTTASGVYLHQCTMEPKRLYEGHRAMDEVEL